ncbi:hypothetical protein K438DRAFT_1620716, partial [Mycena galopus ATCC 62051]
PYRRDNIEKVRRDEEEGRQDETKEEGRMLLADSEARIDLLRERAGVKGLSTVSKSKRHKEDDNLAQLTAAPAAGGSMQPATDWQINFFEDLEHVPIATAIRTAKKTEPVETERGVPLAPSAKRSLRPWYTESRTAKPDQEEAGEKRKRDTTRKSVRVLGKSAPSATPPVTTRISRTCLRHSRCDQRAVQQRALQKTRPNQDDGPLASTTRLSQLCCDLRAWGTDPHRTTMSISRRRRQLRDVLAVFETRCPDIVPMPTLPSRSPARNTTIPCESGSVRLASPPVPRRYCLPDWLPPHKYFSSSRRRWILHS